MTREPTTYPGTDLMKSITEPTSIGELRTGGDATITLHRRNVVVLGKYGSGTSNLVAILTTRLAAAWDATAWIFDADGESACLDADRQMPDQPAVHAREFYVARTAADVVRLTRQIRSLIARREAGDPGVQLCQVTLVITSLPRLIPVEMTMLRETVEYVASAGAAVNVNFVLETKTMTTPIMTPEILGNADYLIGMGSVDPDDAHLFGLTPTGWSGEFTGDGLLSDGTRKAVEFTAFRLTPGDARTLIAGHSIAGPGSPAEPGTRREHQQLADALRNSPSAAGPAATAAVELLIAACDGQLFHTKRVREAFHVDRGTLYIRWPMLNPVAARHAAHLGDLEIDHPDAAIMLRLIVHLGTGGLTASHAEAITTAPHRRQTMTPGQKPGTYSARTIRVLLLTFATISSLTALFLVNGWLAWLLTALAVIAFCAAITPPFRRPR